MPALLAIWLLALVLMIRTEPPEVSEVRRRTCRHCDYSLDGLAEGAMCPECGCDTPSIGFEVILMRFEFRDGALLRAALTLIAWLVAVPLVPALAVEAVSWHYSALGATPELARWLSQQNELNPSRSWEVIATDVLWPLLLPMFVMPLTAPLPWRRWWIVNGSMLGTGLIVFVLRWCA